MEDKTPAGWLKMVEGYPWYRCSDCYPIAAYSEFMPPPVVGKSLFGETDNILFSVNDPSVWHITEIEEEYELKPGIEKAGRQIMDNIIRLGRGLPEHHIHGHNDENLKDNPYWPPDLASRAGTLFHERFVSLLPVMLSRTQDDKGRVTWTFFGNSILDPETAFWKNFQGCDGEENAENLFISFFSEILSGAYDEKCEDAISLFQSGFRILQSDAVLPDWAKRFAINELPGSDEARFLLTFKPFGSLPSSARESYLSGRLSLLPFPGSLVFWGMPGYLKLKGEFQAGGQIPLLNMVLRNRGVGGLRVTQAGWFREQREGDESNFNPRLLHEYFHRTHRWQRLQKYQDELNEAGDRIKIVKVLFSTEPDAMGLYDKPLARNSHIWNSNFELLLDGPNATRKEISEAEKKIAEGGLFGYRFYYPPMRVGKYDVFLHRIIAAWLPAGSDSVAIDTDKLSGYITGYHRDDRAMDHPVEMWPRPLRRELYISAVRNFQNDSDHYIHQTSLNIISLLEAWRIQNRKPLPRSFARNLLNISREKTLEEWLNELPLRSNVRGEGEKMKNALPDIIEQTEPSALPEAITYPETATRQFEINWWNDIRYLAHGRFKNKDNADIALDNTTLSVIKNHRRDLESLGDYLIDRHRMAIAESGLEGIAQCGELAFSWQTDFEFPFFGGWKENQVNETCERNILMVIPGKNRKEAVILADHYDTAYMEDIYDKERGGSGARLSANGADDDYSATSAILQAAPVFLRLAGEGKLERDIWLLHLTGEEFPSDCMGARNLCQSIVEKRVLLNSEKSVKTDLSETSITGVFVMDMIGHNRDNDRDIFQISPGSGNASLYLAWQAHISNQIWNNGVRLWNQHPDRKDCSRGKRVSAPDQIPEIAKFLHLDGEVRTRYNPHSSLYNTDGQIFSDTGIPVVLFMENYDINRSGYHDTRDTLENIDLDYGAAFAAIAIETVARMATASGDQVV